MVQVCLVQMPYSDLVRPSMALGLLKAYLLQRDISTTVVYGNLRFAARVGLEVFKAVEDSPPESLLGEWTFAKAAFLDAAPNTAAPIARLANLADHGWFKVLRRLHPHLDLPRMLTAVRDVAPAFIDDLARDILELNPRIVGCTSTFQQHCASLALLRHIKELSPATVTMMGGANCEGSMGETTHRHFPWLDFVMSGEVDAFFGSFCELLLNEGLDAAARRAPEGVFGPRERARSTVRLVPPRAVLQRLDEAATPEFDDYFDALRASPLQKHISPVLVFESSRGCWWGMKHHCTFCGLNGEGMVFRAKSPARVIEEIESLGQKHQVRWIQAVDNIIDASYLQTVLPVLAERENHPYLFYEVKANLRRDQLALMSRAGIRRIQPGIESLHDDVLQLLDKGNRWFTNIQLLKWAQAAGIEVSWNFLAGVPGERDEWYLELAGWLPAVYHLTPPENDGVSLIRYDRFSVYHNSPGRYGLELAPYQAYASVYPLPEDALAGLAYFFEDVAGDGARSACEAPGHRTLDRRIAEWRAAHTGNGLAQPARLTARNADGRLLVFDTRPIAAGHTFAFEGLERAILEACESARTSSGLVEVLVGEGYAADQVRASTERLKELHLLLEWRGHILSLHVTEPVTPLIAGMGDSGLIAVAPLLRQSRSNPLIYNSIVEADRVPVLN